MGLVLGRRCDRRVRGSTAPGSPAGIAGYANRRVKNDVRDATLLADLLRMGRLPEAWVAPAEIRELREVVPAKLARLRLLKAQVHQTWAKKA